jgi:hypothetical protein
MSAEMIRRRNLPHWDVPIAAYFVTVCLDGSIPARGLLDLANYRTELSRRPRPQDAARASASSTVSTATPPRNATGISNAPAPSGNANRTTIGPHQ